MDSPGTRIIAHTGDLHFQVAQLDDALACFRVVIDTAIDRRCDALVIPGDIWERETLVNESSPLMPVVRMIRVAAHSMAVVMCYGNHDKPGSLEIFKDEIDVHVFDRPGSKSANGIYFSAIPYPSKSFMLSTVTAGQDASDEMANEALRNIAAGFAAEYASDASMFRMKAETPHVLLYHGGARGGSVESGQTMYGGDVMIGAQELEASGADYVAMAHYHKAQKMGDRCYFPGSLYHKNYGEVAQKYFNIVKVWRGGHEVEMIPLPSRPRILLQTTYEKPRVYVTPEGQDMPDVSGANVRVRVSMTAEQRRIYDRDEIIAEFPTAHSVKPEPIVRPTSRAALSGVEKAKSLRDKVRVWATSTKADVDEETLAIADEIEREVEV